MRTVRHEVSIDGKTWMEPVPGDMSNWPHRRTVDLSAVDLPRLRGSHDDWVDGVATSAIIAAEKIRAILLELPEAWRGNAMLLVDMCTHCWREMGGRGCQCWNDE